MKLLVLEDDPALRHLLARGLREEGHEVTVAGDIAEARAALSHGHELLLVDRMLPDGDGLALIRELRRHGDTTPAICLTARDAVGDRVDGLRDGADDYIVKPFAFEELLARIDAVTRRQAPGRVGDGADPGAVPTVLHRGDLRIDLAAHRVWRGPTEIQLTAQEFRLLVTLAEAAGRVLSRPHLLERVWDMHHDPGTNVVDVYVSYLRAKIDAPGLPRLVHTVRGVGYVLDPDRAS
jgi:DNA-binding response OmpR family regulator